MPDITYIWERRAGESKRDYKMFLHYMTFKNLDDIAKEFHITKRSVYRAVKKWDWKKRAQAYEAFYSSIDHPEDMEIIPSEHKPVTIQMPESKPDMPKFQNPMEEIARAELKMYFDFKKAAEKINERVINDSYVPCRDELALIKLAQDQTTIVTRILGMISLDKSSKEEEIDFSVFSDEEFEQIVKLSRKVS